MNGPGADISSVYLFPGELYIGEEPTVVTTVLGSCVSLTLFHKRLGVGAICHALMAHCSNADTCTTTCIECFKYVDCTIKHMVRKFKVYGVKIHELEAKLFGGADILAAITSNSIGTANIKAALKSIKEERLKLVAQDVGDSFGRKVIFHTHTGEVLVKRFRNAENMKPGAARKNPRGPSKSRFKELG